MNNFFKRMENEMSALVRDIVLRAVEAQELLLGSGIDRSLGDEAPLFGGAGPFDSMALVSLITHIEELVDTELQMSVILVSEKAMSARRSPFATVATLVAFVNDSLPAVQHD
jgi:acyl carrier protein